jgi:hypothetical protein
MSAIETTKATQECLTDLVFRGYQNTVAWFVAYLAGFGSSFGHLTVGIDIFERGHVERLQIYDALVKISRTDVDDIFEYVIESGCGEVRSNAKMDLAVHRSRNPLLSSQ